VDTPTCTGDASGRGDARFTLPPRWQVQREIGRGGQAAVWLARDAELDTVVAIKVFGADLGDTQRERLRREVLLGRTLHHPGLVRVYELIDGGDRLAVAMEWVPEGSLAQRLEAGPLPVVEVARVAGEVLEVLAHLHERGIVHRDVKPSNLLVDGDGRVRLADLGLARPLADGRGLTRTLAAVGTPAYMSPEQIRGEAPAPAADFYGLGVTLYQLTTGKLPFAGTSEFDVANKHLTEPVGDPRRLRRDCPAWLAGFILRLLEKSPRDRFESAAAALAALGRRRRLVSPRTWRRAAAAAAVLAVVGAGAAIAVRYGRREAPASVTVTGSNVTARSPQGSELWSRSFPETRPSALVGDILGDARPEVLLGLDTTAGTPSAARDLLVLDGVGKQLAAIASAETLLLPPHDVFSDLVGGPRPYAIDLDGDGRAELVWINWHKLWYPSVVGAWNPRAGVQPGALLVHSGHLGDIRGADLDGDGVNELVATGVNNPLGWQLVVAVLKPTRNANGGYHGGSSPDMLSSWVAADFRGGGPVATYTLLGPHGAGSTLLDAGRWGMTFEIGGRKVRLDADGNPEWSPLYGRGGDPRRRFWSALAVECKALEAGRAGGGVEALRRSHAQVLQEPPMRLAATLLLARSLAVGGRHAAAVDLLRASLAEAPGDLDLRLRLGEQLAIAGDRRAAIDELVDAAQMHTVGRTPFDATLTWAFVAGLAGDDAEMGRAFDFWRASNSEDANSWARNSSFRAVWAFFAGAWRDPSLQAHVSSADMPFVQVLSEWAALERGADPAVVATRAAALAANAEIRDLARVLQAHALARAGRAEEGKEAVAAAVDSLSDRARTDVLALAWLALAHRVSGEAADAAGDRRSAAEHYRKAARIAPRCWFGRPPATR